MLDHGASIGTGYAAYLGLWYMRDWFNWLFFGLWYHLGLPESLAMIHETFKEYATCCCHLLLLPGFFHVSICLLWHRSAQCPRLPTGSIDSLILRCRGCFCGSTLRTEVIIVQLHDWPTQSWMLWLSNLVNKNDRPQNLLFCPKLIQAHFSGSSLVSISVNTYQQYLSSGIENYGRTNMLQYWTVVMSTS